MATQEQIEALKIDESFFFRNYSCVEDTSASEKLKYIWHFTRLFVTLDEFAGFLYIKAMQRIEKFLGYELATVLNSTFCYKLHQRTPDGKPPAVLWLIIGCKDNHSF